MITSVLLRELRSAPIPAPALVPFLNERDYRTALRTALASVTVLSSPIYTEPLSNCLDHGILGCNYYYHQAMRKFEHDRHARNALLETVSESIPLRLSIITDLRYIDEVLRPFGIRLYLLSGYRSPQLQRLVRMHATQEQDAKFTDRMLADPEVHLPHATGAAFDLELWSENDASFLPTKIPHHFERDYLERRYLSSDEEHIRDNRRLIHNLLATNAIVAEEQRFIPHPFEYWHYGRHEKLSVVFAKMYNITHEAYYPEINIEDHDDATC